MEATRPTTAAPATFAALPSAWPQRYGEPQKYRPAKSGNLLLFHVLNAAQSISFGLGPPDVRTLRWSPFSVGDTEAQRRPSIPPGL